MFYDNKELEWTHPRAEQRSILRQMGMYETCVILSCDYGRLSYFNWQSKMDDKKW